MASDQSIPPVEPLSREQQTVLDLAMNGRSLFITGEAGTGKSFLLRRIIEKMKATHAADTIYVTASTGSAAFLIGGSTLHSYAGIRLGQGTVSELMRYMNGCHRKRWLMTSVLIIDEISMIKPDLFDKLEEIARRMKRSKQPFGGIQLIACGDFYQLPPVYKDGDGPVRYCFDAMSWADVIDNVALLQEVHRQKDDNFLRLLREVRRGYLSDTSARYLEAVKGAATDKMVHLRSRRCTVDMENAVALDGLTTDLYQFDAIDVVKDPSWTAKLEDQCRAPHRLVLREGAIVLLIVNLDVPNGLCNGARGMVTGFPNGDIEVKFDHGPTKLILPYTFEAKMGADILASRKQYPLILGWSITIHKSQGMTLTGADIELGHIFAEGMAYTALSRVRNLTDMSIDMIPPAPSIITNPRVDAYYDQLD